MPDEAVHTFSDLAEPLLPEDSSEADAAADPVFKSASQFGPMGIPGLGLSLGTPGSPDAAPADTRLPALLSGGSDVENPALDAGGRAVGGAAAAHAAEVCAPVR